MPSKIKAVEMKAENLFCAGKEREIRIISSAALPKEFVREESREEKTSLHTDKIRSTFNTPTPDYHIKVCACKNNIYSY